MMHQPRFQQWWHGIHQILMLLLHCSLIPSTAATATLLASAVSSSSCYFILSILRLSASNKSNAAGEAAATGGVGTGEKRTLSTALYHPCAVAIFSTLRSTAIRGESFKVTQF